MAHTVQEITLGLVCLIRIQLGLLQLGNLVPLLLQKAGHVLPGNQSLLLIPVQITDPPGFLAAILGREHQRVNTICRQLVLNRSQAVGLNSFFPLVRTDKVANGRDHRRLILHILQLARLSITASLGTILRNPARGQV